jgi:RHS repeat-associated protein
VGETVVRDAWGNKYAGGTTERYGYSQREHDLESGLVYMRARMYDPRTGRLTQDDPVVGNRPSEHYAYAGNNPVSRADPTGRYWTLPVGVSDEWMTSLIRGASRWFGAEFYTGSEGKLMARQGTQTYCYGASAAGSCGVSGTYIDRVPHASSGESDDLFFKYSQDDTPHELEAFMQGVINRHGKGYWDYAFAGPSPTAAGVAALFEDMAQKGPYAFEAAGGALMWLGGPISGAAGTYIFLDAVSGWSGTYGGKDVFRQGHEFYFGEYAKYTRPGMALVMGGVGAAGPAITRFALVKELSRLGIKHTPEAIMRIFRARGGKIVWLESGNETAGFQHILSHEAEFLAKGITRDQIPDLLQTALQRGRVVGYQSSTRPIYEVSFGGKTHRIGITVSENGFIVGANPSGGP